MAVAQILISIEERLEDGIMINLFRCALMGSVEGQEELRKRTGCKCGSRFETLN